MLIALASTLFPILHTVFSALLIPSKLWNLLTKQHGIITSQKTIISVFTDIKFQISILGRMGNKLLSVHPRRDVVLGVGGE
jgi:hypothetical protein